MASHSSLREHREEAYLYRRLATLRVDAPIAEELDDLRWQGARQQELMELCRDIDDEGFLERVTLWRPESDPIAAQG